jgi:hypothetical protein
MQTHVTVILGPFLENDLLHLAAYYAVDVLSLSNERFARQPMQTGTANNPETADDRLRQA